MAFRPSVNLALTIDGIGYQIAEHPEQPGQPYAIRGEQGFVYVLVAPASGPDGRHERRALKVFEPEPPPTGLIAQAERLGQLADVPGLAVCRRIVLEPRGHFNVVRRNPDLLNAIVMPWLEGPTWEEVIQEGRPFTREQSAACARGLGETLARMEERGFAHSDLGGANLMLPNLAPGAVDASHVEIIDVEKIFGLKDEAPEELPAGAPGYTHLTAHQGIWQAEADRFSGALLLAEMLGWCDERVREAAWGASYFDPGELQHDCERQRLLSEVLREHWGDRITWLFVRAWDSVTIAECPSFMQWRPHLPTVQQAAASVSPSKPPVSPAGPAAPPPAAAWQPRSPAASPDDAEPPAAVAPTPPPDAAPPPAVPMRAAAALAWRPRVAPASPPPAAAIPAAPVVETTSPAEEPAMPSAATAPPAPTWRPATTPVEPQEPPLTPAPLPQPSSSTTEAPSASPAAGWSPARASEAEPPIRADASEGPSVSTEAVGTVSSAAAAAPAAEPPGLPMSGFPSDSPVRTDAEPQVRPAWSPAPPPDVAAAGAPVESVRSEPPPPVVEAPTTLAPVHPPPVSPVTGWRPLLPVAPDQPPIPSEEPPSTPPASSMEAGLVAAAPPVSDRAADATLSPDPASVTPAPAPPPQPMAGPVTPAAPIAATAWAGRATAEAAPAESRVEPPAPPPTAPERADPVDEPPARVVTAPPPPPILPVPPVPPPVVSGWRPRSAEPVEPPVSATAAPPPTSTDTASPSAAAMSGAAPPSGWSPRRESAQPTEPAPPPASPNASSTPPASGWMPRSAPEGPPSSAPAVAAAAGWTPAPTTAPSTGPQPTAEQPASRAASAPPEPPVSLVAEDDWDELASPDGGAYAAQALVDMAERLDAGGAVALSTATYGWALAVAPPGGALAQRLGPLVAARPPAG